MKKAILTQKFATKITCQIARAWLVFCKKELMNERSPAKMSSYEAQDLIDAFIYEGYDRVFSINQAKKVKRLAIHQAKFLIYAEEFQPVLEHFRNLANTTQSSNSEVSNNQPQQPTVKKNHEKPNC